MPYIASELNSNRFLPVLQELETQIKAKFEKLLKIIKPAAMVFVSIKNKKSIIAMKDKIAQLSAEIPSLNTDVPRTYEVTDLSSFVSIHCRTNARYFFPSLHVTLLPLNDKSYLTPIGLDSKHFSLI